ncbi:hypothetical protein MNBD_UNCLBAC01-1784 [hydrothermal vent metagenome]|uniref:Subunit of Alternative cytochrome c oxidase n=1 Tax=hydrothermal vent metagenome TaxID=652676 RepID=A0A3B1DJ76_9ZZZZ
MSEDHKKLYIINAVWLTLLTLLELGVGKLPFPKTGQVAILLAFAATKILLVAMIYMHLKNETRALKIAVALPIPVAIIFTVSLMYDLPYQYVF